MNVTLTAGTAGQRADQFLAAALDGLTRSAAQKLLEEGRVLRGGTALKKNDRLQPGDQVTLCIPDPTPVEILPQEIPLDVVYEDGDVIVVNKPVGLVVHPAPGHPDGTLVNALLYHCGQSLSGINGQLRPGIVHRIDRDTSGLIIAAKNDMAHLALAQQLQDHSLYREYEAVVVGNFREDQGTISLPIARHPTDRKKMAINEKNGKDAITHYKVLERFDKYTYMEFKLETGRTHQIRVHMASIGHPLLGDTLYSNGKSPYKLQGQTLHAMTIGFIHPRTREYMEISAPLPEYFEKILRDLR